MIPLTESALFKTYDTAPESRHLVCSDPLVRRGWLRRHRMPAASGRQRLSAVASGVTVYGF